LAPLFRKIVILPLLGVVVTPLWGEPQTAKKSPLVLVGEIRATGDSLGKIIRKQITDSPAEMDALAEKYNRLLDQLEASLKEREGGEEVAALKKKLETSGSQARQLMAAAVSLSQRVQNAERERDRAVAESKVLKARSPSAESVSDKGLQEVLILMEKAIGDQKIALAKARKTIGQTKPSGGG